MPRTKFISLEEAAKLIPNNGVISISSSSALGCPDAMLRAIGQRFTTTGMPSNLTTIHPIAAGDMYGVLGVDYIAYPSLLKRIIGGSYPSGPSSHASPRIWQMIDNNEVEAYNLPSGVLYHMHREVAAARPGILTKVGMDTFVDPRRMGGRMNSATTEDIVRVVEFDGDEWLYFKSIIPDVAIIRGTTADEFGNISMEHEGAYLGAYDQALAAHNTGGIVIAQVKRISEGESIPAQQVRVPGILVDYVVLDPDQKQTTQTIYEPAISGETRVPSSQFEFAEWGADKVIARRAAQELCQDDAVNLGFGISALVPRILLEEGLHNEVTWVIEQGAVGGVPLLGFQFGCAANTQAIVSSADQFTYFQGGGFNCSLLSFMQVDKNGNVNVSRLSSKPHVTAGAGGFIDITNCASHIVFCGYFTAGGLDLALDNGQLRILKEGKVWKFVPEVEHVTFSGNRAKEQQQKVIYVTERCVISLESAGLTVVEVAPGIDLTKDVINQSEIPLHVSPNLRLMDSRLFYPTVMNLKLGDRPLMSRDSTGV